MALDKKLWERSISSIYINDIPKWLCPTCDKGILKTNKNNLRFRESPLKLIGKDRAVDDDSWRSIILKLGSAYIEAKQIHALFTCFLYCNNKECKQVVAACGTTNVAHADTTQSQKFYSIHVEYFSPPLLIFPLRSEYPPQAKIELLKSFKVFFAEPSSAGNKIRTSVERLMDVVGIEKSLSLHQRLKEFKNQQSDLGKMLMNLKLFGNEATHAGNISQSDVLDSYEVIEYVLDQLFIQPKNRERIKKTSNSLGNCFNE